MNVRVSCRLTAFLLLCAQLSCILASDVNKYDSSEEDHPIVIYGSRQQHRDSLKSPEVDDGDEVIVYRQQSRSDKDMNKNAEGEIERELSD